MTPEEKRLENAKARLIDAAIHYTNRCREYPFTAETTDWQRTLLVAAMDYAETVHYVEWSRHQTAKEREERLQTGALEPEQ